MRLLCLTALLLVACSSSHDAWDDAAAPEEDAAVPLGDMATFDLEPDLGLANLYVYGAVPGLAPSDKFTIRVRPAGATAWQDVFAFITSSVATVGADQSYWDSLDSWTHTYGNFETDGATEVEIARADGTAIGKAAAHPVAKAQSLAVTDGKVYVTIAGPVELAIDVDGQMDDHDTGLGPNGRYAGPPIDAVTIFANPILSPRPQPTDPGTYVVMPGEAPPTTSDGWTTLYFAPGVHDIGLAYPVHAGLTYYIPGDAIVYGTFTQETYGDGHDIHFRGYGTVSGNHITHPDYVVPPPTDQKPYGSIFLAGAPGSSVEGLTFVDSAFHTLILQGAYDEARPTTYSWSKIIGWRKNGDGINPFANGAISDCFIRTQDDGSYANGRGITRTTYWNDANGSVFVLSALPNDPATQPLVIDDDDVIYARAWYNKWSGGRIFDMRGEGGGQAGSNVTFSNIRLEDARPTLQAFMILMGEDPPYETMNDRTAGALSGVLFQHVTLAASSVLGEPDTLFGTEIAPITGLTFDDVTIAGVPITSAHFTTNAYVTNLTVTP